METPVIIGIAGGTGSGKTTVARAIYDRVGSGRIEWISHDSYYRSFDGLSTAERHKINFDHPDSLETELLIRHLDVLAKGSSVEVPMYDFATHSRRTDTQRVEPKRVIIVEGILALAEPELRKRIDIKLFVDTPADITVSRRLGPPPTWRRARRQLAGAGWKPAHRAGWKPAILYLNCHIRNASDSAVLFTCTFNGSPPEWPLET
jgi:uridine kinase